MPLRTKKINQLIESLHDFINSGAGYIKSESFSNITISINSSLDSLQKLKDILLAFNALDVTQVVLNDAENENISLSEIQDNIDLNYIDFDWKISFNKSNWFSFNGQTVSVFFVVDNFESWLNGIDVFNRDHEFLKSEKLQIILPMYEGDNIVGKSFLITQKLQENWECGNTVVLPSDGTIKEFVHLVSSDSIIFNPDKFVFEINDYSEGFEPIFRTKYAEILLATIVQVFNSKDSVTIKGLKHFQTKLNDNTIPDKNTIQILEKVIKWAYEENTNTRLQLLADRLSFHEHNDNSFMEIVTKHLEEAFMEAKDRYKFIVTQKSEEYTKDLRDLLKDTKEKTDKYSEKTRNIINSLLRDILGSVFFLGLTAYSRFSGNGNFIFSDDAHIIFIILGSYFLISMVLQATFNIWDMVLSQKEAHKWSKSSMDYMTRETYDNYVTNPLAVRTWQFGIVQFVIIVVYIILACMSFNAQDITKKISNKTSIKNHDISYSIKNNILYKTKNLKQKQFDNNDSKGNKI